jgi:hypothetical protein
VVGYFSQRRGREPRRVTMAVNLLDLKVKLPGGTDVRVACVVDGPYFYVYDIRREPWRAHGGKDRWSLSVKDKNVLDWLYRYGEVKVILSLQEADGTERYRAEYFQDLLTWTDGPPEGFWLIEAGFLSGRDGRVARCS